jgi:hypothetical protein
MMAALEQERFLAVHFDRYVARIKGRSIAPMPLPAFAEPRTSALMVSRNHMRFGDSASNSA